jgi:hypothetical protein
LLGSNTHPLRGVERGLIPAEARMKIEQKKERNQDVLTWYLPVKKPR